MIGVPIGIAVVLILLAFIAVNSLRILREYQRGVVFQLGRFWKVKGPGLVVLIPGIQQMVRIDLRIVVMDVPSQDVISRDNVTLKVNAVLYFRVVDPQRAVSHKVIHAEGELQAAEKLAQAAQILATQPQAIQLRYLETLTVIAADKNSTIVFPLPMDIVAPLIDAMKRVAPPAA